MHKRSGEFTASERRKHIEDEASFKATVLGEFKFAREQRTEDKKDINDRFDRMEKKHTDTYTAVFEKIEKNGKAIAVNATNIGNVQKKSAGIGGASGLGGGAIILFLKELYSSFTSGN